MLFFCCSPVVVDRKSDKSDDIQIEKFDVPQNKKEIRKQSTIQEFPETFFYPVDKKIIRVGLLESKRINFKIDQGYRVLGTILKSGAYISDIYNGKLRILSGKRVLVSGEELVLEPEFKNSSFIIPSKKQGKGWHWEQKGNIPYNGEIIISKKGSTCLVVNKLDIEDYLKGVVPSEMPSKAGLEPLKAQAVLARTNAYHSIVEQNGKYDIFSDVYDQVFLGNLKRSDVSDLAVDLTKNEILTYEEQPIYVYFHAVSGGRTEKSSNVWNNVDLPYITPVWTTKTVPSLDLSNENDFKFYIENNFTSFFNLEKYNVDEGLSYLFKYYRWELRSSKKSIEARMSKKYKNIGKFKSIDILKRTSSGKVISIKINGDKGSYKVDGELSIRRILSDPPLYSSNFYYDVKGDDILFLGSGHGHGAGLCQSSAIGMAIEGRSYKEIVSLFYPGTKFSKVISK
ncbi:MAG: SpoIID/LytB domain-containing protein [Candidatus Delongbacteria bacterium]|nr:SpoIID/LytB domain-containing protein [Candidatus Delongbacteria bacterium]